MSAVLGQAFAMAFVMVVLRLAAYAGRKAAHLNPVVKGLLCALLALPMASFVIAVIVK